MKNLKKVLALVLALSMILSTFTALTITAYAEDAAATTTTTTPAATTTPDATTTPATTTTATPAETATPATTAVTTAAATGSTFSDIEGKDYADAVEVLYSLGVVSGYEDGTFGGEKTVTRAEMAAFIVREIGLSAAAKSAAANSSTFSDVAADHWAVGSINIANQKKIIVGMGNNTFAPNDTVTYQQAVKMLVCALGYEVVANRNGGWPSGYLIEGAAIGLTDGIDGVEGNEGCNRGVVAVLLYNALEINLMEETSFSGSAVQVEETYKTLLYDNLSVRKYYDAEITATPTQGASKTATGFAKIAGSYDSYAVEGLKESSLKVEIGKTNPDKFFGDAVIIYCKDNGTNKTPTMLCIVSDKATQDTFDIAVSDFYSSNFFLFPEETNTEGTNNTKYCKLYYKTENDTKPQSVKLLNSDQFSSACQLVINGVVENNPDWTKLRNLQNGTIKLVDAKSYDTSDGKSYAGADGIYEKVIVDTYYDFVVSDVDYDKGIVSTQNGEDITLDETKTYSIVDKDGKELKVEDLKENDVLSVYSDNMDGIDYIDDSEVLKIVVCSAPIEGKVTEKTSKAVYIDGQKYDIAGSLVSLDDIALDDEGTFYLNTAGDIVYTDTTAAAKDYAVFYDVYADGSRKMVFNVLTSKGEDLELNATTSMDVVNYKTIVEKVVSGDKTTYVGKYVKLPVEEYDFAEFVKHDTATNKDIYRIDELATALGTSKANEYKPYIASYKLKSGSTTQIDTVYLSGSVTCPVTDEQGNPVLDDHDKPIVVTAEKFATRFANWAIDVSSYYNSNENTLGAYIVDSSTVVFDIPVTVKKAADSDKIKVIGKSGLTNDKTYDDVSVYDVDKNNIAKAVLIKSASEAADVKSPLAIIQSITAAKNSDGDDVYKVYMIQNGKVISKLTDDKDTLAGFGTGTVNDGYTQYSLKIAYNFYPGAAILFNETSDGAIDSLTKIYPTTYKPTDYDGSVIGDETEEVPYYRSVYFTTWNGSDVKGTEGCDCFIVYGKVLTKSTTNNTITIDTMVKKSKTATWETYSTTANYNSASVTVVDYAFDNDEDRVTIGTTSDIKVGSYVLVRKKGGITKDIVVYKENFKPDDYADYLN